MLIALKMILQNEQNITCKWQPLNSSMTICAITQIPQVFTPLSETLTLQNSLNTSIHLPATEIVVIHNNSNWKQITLNMRCD